MKGKILTLAGLCALAVALAVPASGAAVGVYPYHVSESGTSSENCGFDVQYDFSDSGAIVIKASGVTVNANEFRAVNTNPATGKSVVVQGSGQFTTGAPIDNGNGTISFIQSGSGNYIVKDANGAPLSLFPGAGRIVVRVTIDAATGDFISAELLSVAGPKAGGDQDFCHALT